MKSVNIDRIISENINRFVKRVINESAFDYVSQGEPINELKEYLSSVGNITFGLSGDFEFETPSYDWYIEYKIDPNVYSTYDSGSYDVEPSYDVHGENDFEFNVFELYCYTKDGEEVPFETTDEIADAFKNIINIDYDGYDIPSADEYFDR